MDTIARGEVEVRGVIASKQGLSCDGYFALSARTAHLRERLYVSVRDGDKVFLPQGAEHFPASEIEDYYLKRLRLGLNQSIGAGGGEVVFICEGRDPEAAEEGADVITRTLAGLEPSLSQGLLGRWMCAIPHKRLHLAAQRTGPRPYRPDILPARASAPADAPLSDSERRRAPLEARGELSERFEAKKREALAAWGLLDAYDRAKAKPRPQRQEPWQNTSWQATPWR